MRIKFWSQVYNYEIIPIIKAKISGETGAAWYGAWIEYGLCGSNTDKKIPRMSERNKNKRLT